MQARYYDPVIGRFYGVDPVGYMEHLNRDNPIHGFNRFTYANNNPYRYTDPDGRFACGGLCVFAVGLAVGYVVDTAIEVIRGEDNSTTNTAGNVVTGGVVAVTGPFDKKPRTGVDGGGPSGDKTSVARNAVSKQHHKGKVSLKTRHILKKVFRKVPYVGTVIAVGQLADAVSDRIEKEQQKDQKKEQKKDDE